MTGRVVSAADAQRYGREAMEAISRAKKPETTDPVIPPEAREATSEAMFIHRAFAGQLGESHCGCGEHFKTAVERQRHASQAVLAAALPHLRPLFEVATQVGLELGRREAGQQIAAALKRRREQARAEGQPGWPLLTEAAVIALELTSGLPDPSTVKWATPPREDQWAPIRESGWDEIRADATENCVTIAREVATRTTDARTDPSGHTDLPPTPDAGSKRLPEEAL